MLRKNPEVEDRIVRGYADGQSMYWLAKNNETAPEVVEGVLRAQNIDLINIFVDTDTKQ